MRYVKGCQIHVHCFDFEISVPSFVQCLKKPLPLGHERELAIREKMVEDKLKRWEEQTLPYNP